MVKLIKSKYRRLFEFEVYPEHHVQYEILDRFKLIYIDRYSVFWHPQ